MDAGKTEEEEATPEEQPKGLMAKGQDMSFDWGAFAGSFLQEVTEGIERRETEAKDYKEEQKKKAERNLELVRVRNQRAASCTNRQTSYATWCY